jgi:hypothetical protein
VGVAKLRDELLEPAPRIAGPVARQHRFEGTSTGASGVAREELVEVGEIEQPQALGSVHRGFEAASAEAAGGEIEQRPRRGRDRQSVQLGDLVGRDRAPPVEADSVTPLASAASHEDVDRPARRRADAIRRRRTHSGQVRAVTARQHGRPAPAQDADDAVPNRVNAAMKKMEPAGA